MTMDAMAVQSFSLTPDLTRYGLDIFDAEATCVIDPVIVVYPLMFAIIPPCLKEHVGGNGSLIGFSLAGIG